MQTFETIADMRAFVQANRSAGKTVGFIPTMGAFHEGHLSLMRLSSRENDVCVVSLFVNPTQFASGEDFGKYPRDLRRDAALAESVGVQALFHPSEEEIYPPGPPVKVHVGELSKRWEGERRPGHFDGVATVCTRLFNIIQPDRSYFGEKDYQQLKIVQRLVQALRIPTVIVPCPTVRETDGLAMSSRNAYLSPSERAVAPAIYRGLKSALAAFVSGERSSTRLAAAARRELRENPKVGEDYIAIVDTESLEPMEHVSARAVVLIAARVGPARLIDNLALDSGVGG